MNKIFARGKLKLTLKIKLILCLIFSFTLSLIFFGLLQTTGESILQRYLTKTSFIANQEQLALSKFKTYVSEENLSLQDHDKIAKWIREMKYVNIYIYTDNKLIYATDGYTSIIENEGLLIDTKLSNAPQLINIQFSDGRAQIHLEYFFEYKYYHIVTILGVALSFLLFLFIMLFFINKKTSYIGTLENEIKILEGGDLTYRITIKGNDELSSLAQSINEMRTSFIERLENEHQARVANSELVTAMSHDLRTPLTALIGYLDIIEFRKYQTDEAFHKYIHNSREKAYQLKHLSDKLFEYFTVFNTEDNNLDFERFDGNQLMDQLLDEQIILLENNGFSFELKPCSIPFHIDVHLISFRRVFDNLFSNIIKYADKSKTVKIHYDIHDGLLLIHIENVVKKKDMKSIVPESV